VRGRHSGEESGADNLPEELEAADALLDQADALLQRHRGAASLITASGDDLAADDLPLLTEVVDALPAPAFAVEAAPAPSQEVLLAERLVALDGAIAREVESWLANELPQLLSAELDRLAERLRSQALAQMRATLLPALSQHLSDTLGPDSPGPDDPA
jgi:hypothetical protein